MTVESPKESEFQMKEATTENAQCRLVVVFAWGTKSSLPEEERSAQRPRVKMSKKVPVGRLELWQQGNARPGQVAVG